VASNYLLTACFQEGNGERFVLGSQRAQLSGEPIVFDDFGAERQFQSCLALLSLPHLKDCWAAI
jgi:hypothetical protein